jgi:hypothetical protein
MRRPRDVRPEPPGGRAAERLRMFENARRPVPTPPEQKPKPAGKAPRTPRPSQKRRTSDAKQNRHKA